MYKMLNGVGVCARACVRACAGVCVWAYENIMMYTITEAMKNNTQQKYNHFIIEPALVLQNEQLLRKRIITSLSTPSHTHTKSNPNHEGGTKPYMFSTCILALKTYLSTEVMRTPGHIGLCQPNIGKELKDTRVL